MGESLKSKVLGSVKADGIVVSSGGGLSLAREMVLFWGQEGMKNRIPEGNFSEVDERKIVERTYISLVLLFPPFSRSHKVGVGLQSEREGGGLRVLGVMGKTCNKQCRRGLWSLSGAELRAHPAELDKWLLAKPVG